MLIVTTVIFIIREISHPAIVEELIFRSVLWGLLRKRGYSEKRILVITTLMFWVMHIGYLPDYYTFGVVVPIGGIVMGLLVYKSKSVSSSIIAHATFNALRITIFYILKFIF